MKYKVKVSLTRDPFKLSLVKGDVLDTNKDKITKSNIELAISYDYIEVIKEVVKPKKKRTVKNKK